MMEISRRYSSLKSCQGKQKQSSNLPCLRRTRTYEWKTFIVCCPCLLALHLHDRYNFTNVDEPYFLLNVLELINARLVEENDSALIAVYAVNQKGRSAGVIIRDLELGATHELDRGERRMQTNLPVFSRPTFATLHRPRRSNSRQFTRLDAVLHRHRGHHPHSVPLHRV
jgi:hypothetical protein